MIKRIVIAGSRNYNNYNEAKSYLDICIENIRERCEIVILSGGCSGADALGERYAQENDFKTEVFPTDWKTYGKSAGPIRNRKMAEMCDLLICFWDGESRGTKSMIDYAKKLDKPVKIILI